MKLYFSDGDHEQVTKIKVMADYGACTYDHEGSGFHLESIGIPAELCLKFEAWEEWYEMNLGEHHIFDAAAFDARGFELATELKRFVGDDIRVTYFSERTHEETEIHDVE
jgi:hypothetical protein